MYRCFKESPGLSLRLNSQASTADCVETIASCSRMLRASGRCASSTRKSRSNWDRSSGFGTELGQSDNPFRTAYEQSGVLKLLLNCDRLADHTLCSRHCYRSGLDRGGCTRQVAANRKDPIRQVRSRKYSARSADIQPTQQIRPLLVERFSNREHCSGNGSQNVSSTASRANCSASQWLEAMWKFNTGREPAGVSRIARSAGMRATASKSRSELRMNVLDWKAPPM